METEKLPQGHMHGKWQRQSQSMSSPVHFCQHNSDCGLGFAFLLGTRSFLKSGPVPYVSLASYKIEGAIHNIRPGIVDSILMLYSDFYLGEKSDLKKYV